MMKRIFVWLSPVVAFFILVQIMTAAGAKQETILLASAALFMPFIIKLVYRIVGIKEEKRR